MIGFLEKKRITDRVRNAGNNSYSQFNHAFGINISILYIYQVQISKALYFCIEFDTIS